MEIVVVEIDGEEVEVEKGKNLLVTAEKAGIEIPHLCYREEFEGYLETYGACRLCSVEIERKGRSRIVAACGYPAEKRLKVKTRTPRIEEIRRALVELIAHRMYPENMTGEILRIVREYGADLSRFDVAEKPEQCILCGLCVRYCEYQMAEALTFVGRGTNREVVYIPGKVGACTGCRGCFELCPTGKLDSTGVTRNLRSIDDFLAGRE